MELSKDKWEKLVCAMFTGVELADGNGKPLVSKEIRKILDKSGTAIKSPYLVALYQENHQGNIVDVLFESGDGELGSDGLPPCIDCPAMQTASMIGMSYSPCTACAEKMVKSKLEGNLPSTIHLAWIHNGDIESIKILIENGFNVKVWETIRIYAQKGPKEDKSKLRKELLQAFGKLIVPLSKRDSMTQQHIEEAWKAIKPAARLEELKAQEGATEGTQKDTGVSKTAEGAQKKTCRRKTATKVLRKELAKKIWSKKWKV